MIRTLRAYFLSRALREKLLLVGILAVIVVVWISNLSSRAGLFWRAQRATTVALKEQAQYLDNQAAIEARAKDAAARLEPGKTLNGPRLFSTISQIASETGVSRNLREESPVPSATNGQLAVNTLKFQLINADWPSIVKFYLALHERSPYIALNSASLQPNRSNPAQMTFVAVVSSVEVAQ
jgi:hypothetical protein